MSENTLVAVLFCTAIGGAMLGLMLNDYQNAQVKLACYEAAKVNTNLKCEVTK